MFWVISVYFNIRNTHPKSGTFLLGHSVYIYIYTHTHTHATQHLKISIKIYEYHSQWGPLGRKSDVSGFVIANGDLSGE